MARFTHYAGRVLWWGAMLIGVTIMVYPLLFSGLAGLMQPEEFRNAGQLLPLSNDPTLQWFSRIFTPIGWRPFVNTILRTTWYTAIVVVQACLAGYVISRFRFPGRNVFFGIVIFAQLIPFAMIMIPTYIWMARLPFFGGNNWMGVGGHGLVNNPLVLYLLVTPGNLLGIFLFKQAMDGLPRDFEEAAHIDGGGFLRTLFTVVLPIQKPIVVTIALFTAIATWNDWFVPFVYIDDFEHQTLPALVGVLTSSASGRSASDANWPLIFALSTMTTFPMLILLFWLQKYIIQGFASAGLKG